jgi:hypothetical protein
MKSGQCARAAFTASSSVAATSKDSNPISVSMSCSRAAARNAAVEAICREQQNEADLRERRDATFSSQLPTYAKRAGPKIVRRELSIRGAHV